MKPSVALVAISFVIGCATTGVPTYQTLNVVVRTEGAWIAPGTRIAIACSSGAFLGSLRGIGETGKATRRRIRLGNCQSIVFEVASTYARYRSSRAMVRDGDTLEVDLRGPINHTSWRVTH